MVVPTATEIIIRSVTRKWAISDKGLGFSGISAHRTFGFDLENRRNATHRQWGFSWPVPW
jgi:hypothetical protein